MRRWVASVLLLALFALASTPSRAFVLALGRAQPSTASAPAERDSGICTAERASPIRIAPPELRPELGTLRQRAVWVPSTPRSARWAEATVRPARWLSDRREAIRRVCRRIVPPEAPWASPVT